MDLHVPQGSTIKFSRDPKRYLRRERIETVRAPEPSERQTLQSWKEIAAFLGVTVRSVQRWEAAGLPVHRQGDGVKARVFAYSDELRAWAESAESRQRPAPEAAPAGSSRSRRWLWPAAAAGAALMAAAFLFWRPRGPEPKSWAVEQSKLVVRDGDGRVCWSKPLPPLETGPERARDQALVADIDGDGQTEVLFNLVPQLAVQPGGSVLCFESDGRLRWEFRFSGVRKFGERVFEPHYRGRFLRLVKVGGKTRILTVADHSLWYPAQVALLDARSGRVIEEYWHPGSIYHCILRDIDGDGQEEMIFGALNNPGEGLGHAAIGILKIPFSKAPRREPAAGFASPTGGGELAYGLFPLPDVCRALARPPWFVDLTMDSLGRIRAELSTPEAGAIVYYLDANLRVLEYRFSDNFAPLHERLYREHLLDHRLDAAERAELGRLVLFPAAPDGNSAAVGGLWRR